MKKYYNLNEGYLSKLDDNNETLISAVDVDNIDKYSKIEKDDKQSFEDFKTQYKGVIDMKCTQDYGNCEDKDLWEDCAKELFLTSKNYLLQGDEYKASDLEKKTENKQLTESDDINVGDEYINDYGAKITILEPTKDGEYQFKVTNTKTGVEGDVLVTRSMKHVLDMNGYKKVESKNSTDNYQIRKYPNEDEFKGTWGLYDLKQDKFIQKGSKYVMQAALKDMDNKQLKESYYVKLFNEDDTDVDTIEAETEDEAIQVARNKMKEGFRAVVYNVNNKEALYDYDPFEGLEEALLDKKQENKLQLESRDRVAENLSKFIYDLTTEQDTKTYGETAWSGNQPTKMGNGVTVYEVYKNGKSNYTMDDIKKAVIERFPELDVYGTAYNSILFYKPQKTESKLQEDTVKFTLNTNLNESNIDKYNTIPEIKDRLREINKQLAYIRRRDSVSLSIGTEQEQEELYSERAKLNGRLRKLRNNAVDMDKMTPEQQKEFKQRLKDLDLLDDDESNLQSVIQSYRNHYIQEFESYTKKEENNTDLEYRYMLLDRLRSDCEYFLGNGNRNEKHLWAGSVDAQINEMKKIWNSLKEKPEWITIEDINNYEKKMKELKTNKQKKTEGTAQKRIARYGEFDNGYVLHNDWREMSDEEAEELAKQASIKDPTDVYYVQYDDIMNPSNDIRWYKGKSYTVDEIIEIRKKEKYALYKKMMQAELEEQCKRFKDLASLTEDQYENERRKGRPSIRKIADEEYYDNEEWYKNHIKDYKDVDDFINQEIFEIASEYNLKEDTAIQVCKEIYNLAIKNQSKTESFKITDPRDKRRKLIVPDKIENVLKSSKFEEIKSAIKKHDGIISNPRIYVNDNKLGLNYSFTGFNDEEHMKVFSDLGFNDLDTISNGQLNGWGYSQYEAPINIEGITVILSYSPGVRIISIEFDYPLKEDTANNEPFYRYDNQENFEKAKREYQRNPNEETLKAFKDARSAFEKEINAKKE